MSAPMTPERLAEIRARAERASTGPWGVCNRGECSCLMIWSGHEEDSHVATGKPVIGCVHGEWGDAPDMIYGEVPPERAKANALFIAAGRQDIPDMLQEIERLRTRNAHLERYQQHMESTEVALHKAAEEIETLQARVVGLTRERDEIKGAAYHLATYIPRGGQ